MLGQDGVSVRSMNFSTCSAVLSAETRGPLRTCTPLKASSGRQLLGKEVSEGTSWDSRSCWTYSRPCVNKFDKVL